MWFGCSDVVAWHLKDPLSKRERDQKKWLDVKRKPFAFFFGGGSTFFLRFGIVIVKLLHATGKEEA